MHQELSWPFSLNPFHPYETLRSGCRFIATALIALSTGATAASGQNADAKVSWGLLGGGSFPIGASGALDQGHHLAAFAELPWTWPWRAVRLEATLAKIPFPVGSVTNEDGEPVGEFTSAVQLRGAMANLILRSIGDASVRSYFVGGVGVFRVATHVEQPGLSFASEARTRVGLNAGLGVQASRGRATLLVEARYLTVLHAVDQPELRLIPVSLGLRLRA